MKTGFFLLLLAFSSTIFAQTIADYSVVLKPRKIDGLMGLQSFAFGQYDGKWIIIGGRLDGLHRRQPFASFDSIGHNNQILVIDPLKGELWKASVMGLPTTLRDQLKSTNMCFTQEEDRLILVGGYGIGEQAGDHLTFPYITTVRLPDLIKEVQNGSVSAESFYQVTDSLAAVTGGQLLRLNSAFYLVGGHRFDGRYNPADRPTFVQTYTNSVRTFSLDEEGNPEWGTTYTDSLLMHRRDFNVALQQTPDGNPYITAFSGVFRYGVDLPYQTAIHISENGLSEQPDFNQYYNHYHCADVSFFETKTGEMHTLFFGGIAQFYDSLGTTVQDNGVPFVKTISRVTRNANGNMTEYRFQEQMPAFLGAGAEFIPNPQLKRSESGIIQIDELEENLFLGTVAGGIASTGRNIFWINDDEESAAFSGLFDVYLEKSKNPQVYNPFSNSSLHPMAVRHASEPRYQVRFNLEKASDVHIQWTNRKGKIKHDETVRLQGGSQTYEPFLPKKPGFCRITLTVDQQEPVSFIFDIPEED